MLNDNWLNMKYSVIMCVHASECTCMCTSVCVCTLIILIAIIVALPYISVICARAGTGMVSPRVRRFHTGEGIV